MNKEVITAVIIGIVLGLIAALYFSNLKPRDSGKDTVAVKTTEIGISAKPQVFKQTKFTRIPDNNKIVSKDTVLIAGETEKDAFLFIQTLFGIENIALNKGKFSHELKLKPGLNEIIIAEHRGDKQQTKIVKVFFLKPMEKDKASTDEESTSEAKLLKEKLEEKVLELRDKAKRVVVGRVKEITADNVILDRGGASEKVKLEREVTDFYEVAARDLSKISIDDVNKGDLLTVFVSEIGGEEKSYTVYKEEDKSLLAGKISGIDKNNYQISVINFDKTTTAVDIETSTVQEVFNRKTKTKEEYGFSKLTIGDYIYAILTLRDGSSGSLDEYLVVAQ